MSESTPPPSQMTRSGRYLDPEAAHAGADRHGRRRQPAPLRAPPWRFSPGGCFNVAAADHLGIAATGPAY